MEARDFTAILKDAPVGAWIALSSDEERIVANAPEFEDAMALAKERGEAEPVLMKLPPPTLLVL